MVRGEVFRLRPVRAKGREQRGARYAVVLQADDLLGLSTAIVAPTSTKAKAASFRPEIELHGLATRVMLDQAMAVDIQRLGTSAGRLAAREIHAVDDALRLVLAL
jgi:mRNA interferase MazF